MNRPVLFALVASLAAAGACDKKEADHAHGPGTHDHAATPADAAPAKVAPVPTPALAPAGPFSVVLTPAGGAAPAGSPASLTLELKDAAGAPVTALDVVHDKRLHLLVVSPDLSFFSHGHPEAQPDGTLTTEVTLPHPATYVAFADFKPTGAPPAVARGTIVVAGEAPAARPLKASKLPASGPFDGFEVSVRSKAPLVAGADAVLEFEISQKGAPISDLQPYLGARGHCVIISEDTTSYLHSHPLGGTGSKVQFHTTLPAPGKYKVWAEFRPGGKPLLASFVIDVPAEGAVPHDEEPGHKHGGEHGHSH